MFEVTAYRNDGLKVAHTVSADNRAMALYKAMRLFREYRDPATCEVFCFGAIAVREVL